MKKTERNRWIPWLMGLSQALLMAFVIYWLIGQFKNERGALHKQLFYEFTEAQNEAMDSTLHVILRPLLMDSLGKDGKPAEIGWVSSSASVDSLHITSSDTGDKTAVEKIIQFEIRDSSQFSSSGKASYEITTIPHQEAVLRGVKMIIKMSSDSLEFKGKSGNSSFPPVDSALLLTNISRRLDSLEYKGLKKIWYPDSLFQKNSKRINFETSFSSPGMVVEFTNYQPLVFKKIFPQILFALVLILLSGSAFLLTYRSLRKQILLNTLRNEFISNVSHELKTPVSTVKVALESLQNFDQKQDATITDEYLKMAAMEMDRLDSLIEKILNQSLLESKQLAIHRQKSNLVKLTADIIRPFKAKVADAGGDLNLATDREEIYIDIDEPYIQGVLVNLIDNAIKYGGSPPKINIKISSDKDSSTLSVADNGAGIPREYREKVFERFFRIPTGNRHNVKGYGLGLTFVSEIMELHEGSVKAEDNPGGGSIFTITFRNSDEA